MKSQNSWLQTGLLFIFIFSTNLVRAQQTTLPSADDIHQSWQQARAAQNVIVQPRDGYVDTATGQPYPIQARVQVTGYMADPDLETLNAQAAQVWDQLLACHGTPEAASAAYISGQPCPQGLQSIKALAMGIDSYLGSAYFDSIHRFDVNCLPSKNCPGLLAESKRFQSQKSHLGTDERPFSKGSTLGRLEDALVKPILHPLFLQIVLDIATQGFPFHVFTKSCDGMFTCNHPRYFLEANQLIDGFYQYIQNNMNEPTPTNGKLRVFGGEISVADVRKVWPAYRRSILALQILEINSLSPSRCESWGLDRQHNFEVLSLVTMSMSSVHPELRPIVDNFGMACGWQADTPHLNFFTTPQSDLARTIRRQEKVAAELAKVRHYWQ